MAENEKTGWALIFAGAAGLIAGAGLTFAFMKAGETPDPAKNRANIITEFKCPSVGQTTDHKRTAIIELNEVTSKRTLVAFDGDEEIFAIVGDASKVDRFDAQRVALRHCNGRS